VESESSKIARILSENSGKNFIQRVINRGSFPAIKNKDGTISTHRMAWADMPDGGYAVYPTIFQESDGKLKEYPGEEAYAEALKRGEYIKFETPDEADWFSKNYKNLWR
jgi:hypothetical protein